MVSYLHAELFEKYILHDHDVPTTKKFRGSKDN